MPLPVPLCPSEIVIQLLLLDAVRVQVLALADTLIIPSLLVYPKLALVGASVNVHAANEGNTTAM